MKVHTNIFGGGQKKKRLVSAISLKVEYWYSWTIQSLKLKWVKMTSDMTVTIDEY